MVSDVLNGFQRHTKKGYLYYFIRILMACIKPGVLTKVFDPLPHFTRLFKR